MSAPVSQQLTRLVPESGLLYSVKSFLLDGESRRLSPRTLSFYRDELRYFRQWVEAKGVQAVESITPDLLRRYLLHLGETRNPGGQHAAYRTLRAFLRWYQREYEPEGWRNPIAKVQPPKLQEDPLPALPLDCLRKMLATCAGRRFLDTRDRAILLGLLDSGCRANEFLSLNLGDVDLGMGTVMVRKGKGGKSRVTFLCVKATKAVLAYLRHRQAGSDEPLWVTGEGGRLTYAGLRQIVRRRALKAEVPEPSLHSFRRAFAIGALRSGMDLVSLQRLLGHADLSVIRRYLKQTEEDLRAAHQKGSPVDHLL